MAVVEPWVGRTLEQARPPAVHSRRQHEASLMSEMFSSSSHEVLELQAAGPHVIASVIFRAEGTGSGVSVEQPEFHVWTFQDDKVSRFAWFRSREDAVKAVGSLE